MPDEGLQAALLAVRDAGHPVVLLTVVEKPLRPFSGLEVHHLGGQELGKACALDWLEMAPAAGAGRAHVGDRLAFPIDGLLAS